ncbi:hypothetical protein ASE01_23320 [Nocardioides sp. Root190]|uniref:hypothetical protein n=1 Tax=Nocardioides sp. Root190 TaxID=1736488 RepID=UPI0006F217EF|nr:hypothetical protein [Nocardioides sp. Root190]KRB79244.1 hypothetical protein ASE01_23320 [Nocardioides sp. Root190]
MTRVYLHIGLQKTGTSYLQNICWGSVDRLRERGVTLVPEGRIETFWLALDVRERVDPAHDGDRVARSLSLLPGQLEAVTTPHALISHETLAQASSEQIERLLQACAGHEVHVVLTVRDLARQVPSLWQEALKAGRSERLDEYVGALRAATRRTDMDWKRLDLSAVLHRWARHVAPERIHVVTVPGGGGPRSALLERYCAVLDVATDDLEEASGPGNPALGVAEAEVLRRVNDLLPQAHRRRVPYGEVGKRYFAMGILARSDSGNARLAREHAEWCREVAEESVRTIEELGCSVSGDVADLVPGPDSFGETARVDDAAALEVATRALATMLEERMVHRLEVRAQGSTDGPAEVPGAWRRAVGRIRKALRRAG